MAEKNNGHNPISGLKEKHKEKLEERKNAFVDKVVSEQAQIRRDKLAALQEAGRDPFVITKWDQDARSADITGNYEEYEGKRVSMAGRIMTKRVMGKASFMHIQDRDGRIQCFVARDNLGTEEYQIFKKYDVGDIVGVKGEVFKTKTGEITIRVEELVLLSKSLQVLPEKFHGLQDIDTRYRQRYVDLIMNPESREVFIKRSRILAEIRKSSPDIAVLAGDICNAFPGVDQTPAVSFIKDKQVRISETAVFIPYNILIIAPYFSVITNACQKQHYATNEQKNHTS